MDLDLLDRFHHKLIRRILKIGMMQVKDEKIQNKEVRSRFNKNYIKLSKTW